MTPSPVCTIVLMLILAVRSIDAQAGGVTLPDTLGANFRADSSGTGHPADFDFLIGTWTIRFQGGPGGTMPGTWTARRIHEGRVIEDVFTISTPNQPPSVSATYRIFNPRRRLWEFHGLSLEASTWSPPGIAWSDPSNRFAVQTEDGRTMIRFRYFDITPDHFRWRADLSRDAGKTWTRDIMRLEATRAVGER
jgi:hypothetical protein